MVSSSSLRVGGSLMLVVLLCTSGSFAVPAAAGGRGNWVGVSVTGEEVARQSSEDDPCGGLCEGLQRSCVVRNNGVAFCMDCSGFKKPTNFDTDSFVDCCAYNPRRKLCVSVLRGSPMGTCMRSEDLFVRGPDPAPASFRGNSGTVCNKNPDFMENGLACRVTTQRDGTVKCIDNMGLEQRPPCSSTFVQVGEDIDGEFEGDWSANAVAMSADGSRMAIGAPRNAGNGVRSGHVRVFETRGSEGWVQIGEDIDGESERDISGSAVAMSEDGSRVAIGSPGHRSSSGFVGQVRVFEMRGGEGWVQVGASILGNSSDHALGRSVALSADGSRVAMGAPVQVYEMQGSEGWVQVGGNIDGEYERGHWGWEIAMSADGSRVVSSDALNSANAAAAGHVRVFETRGSEGWVQVGQNINGRFKFDQSGRSVAMSSDGIRVAIGSPFNDGNGRSSGHVRVFQMQGNEGWVQVGEDINGESADVQLGWSVAMSADGNRVVVGSPSHARNLSDPGHVQLYEMQASEGWVQVGQNIEGKFNADGSGWSVAISADGSRVATGSRSHARHAGHVRVFDFTKPCQDDTEEEEACNSNFVQLGESIDRKTEGEHWGRSLATSADGSRVVIGAPINNENRAASGFRDMGFGVVRVFERQGSGGWVQVGEDFEGDSQGDQLGVSVAMSEDGSRLAIGARNNNGSYLGYVRVFESRGSEGWVQVGEDIDGGEEYTDGVGSVAMSADGSRVVIGSPYNREARLTGVRIFEMQESEGWVQMGETISAEDYITYGHSVAMSADGNRVAFGVIEVAFLCDCNEPPYVTVWEFQGSSGWEQVGSRISGWDQGSFTMSADGNRVAVPLLGDFDNGGIKVFRMHETGRWQSMPVQPIHPPNGDYDIFGNRGRDYWIASVAMSADGNLMAVGGPDSDVNGIDSGQVRVFEWNENTWWAQLGENIDGESEGEWLGSSVAMSADGRRVFIGSGGSNVRVFQLPCHNGTE